MGVGKESEEDRRYVLLIDYSTSRESVMGSKGKQYPPSLGAVSLIGPMDRDICISIPLRRM